MQPMLNIALRAARSAGELIVRSMERLDTISGNEQDAKDFVTEIDRAAEKAIITAILKAHPDHSIHAQASASIAGQGEGADYEWTIQSLDGVQNFIRGVPHFAVSIACKFRGRLEHAVIIDPVRQEEFTASRGRGAAFNGRRIRVSKRKTLSDALLATHFPFSEGQTDHMDNYMSMLTDLAVQSAGIRTAGVSSLNLAYVAAGRYDAFWTYNLSEADMAAGVLIIQEAGGLVSDFNGGYDFLDRGHIVVGGSKCFKAVLTTIQPHIPHSFK